MFTVNVAKDGWDIFNIIVTIILTIFSLVLIYKCSSMISDKNKKVDEEKAALDFLLIILRRYISYLIAIKSAIRSKMDYINIFLNGPNNIENRKFAFALIYLIPELKIELSKYDFTINSQPSIVDDILLYQELYQEISAGVDRVNYVSSMAVNINNPLEITIKTANDLIAKDKDLYILEILVSEAIVILKRIFDSVIRCKEFKKYDNSLTKLLDKNTINIVKDCERFLNSTNEKRWKYKLKDIIKH